MTTAVAIQDVEKAKKYFADKMAFTTGPVELNRALESGFVNVVDVRKQEDYAKGHIPGAVHLPKEKWSTLQGLNKDKINVLYCYSQVCHLAAAGALQFAGQGFPVQELEGGFETWEMYGMKVEK